MSYLRRKQDNNLVSATLNTYRNSHSQACPVLLIAPLDSPFAVCHCKPGLSDESLWKSVNPIVNAACVRTLQVVLLENSGDKFKLKASKSEDMHVLIIGGVPLNEPVARHGPFVMNTQKEIHQAFDDYQSGKLGRIEGSEHRYAETRAAVAQQKKSGNYYK
eukprot:gene129-740_t